MSEYKAKTPSTYQSPLAAGFDFHFVSSYEIFPYRIPIAQGYRYWTEEIFLNGNKIHDYDYIQNRNESSKGFTTKLQSGIYAAVYTMGTGVDIGNPPRTEAARATYTFQVVQNQYPPKKFTVKDTVDRILTLVEPLVVERDTALPSYIRIVQGLIKNINEPGGVDKLFSCLDRFYKQGGQAKRCAITFYTNMQKSLMNLFGDTKFADLKKSLDTDNFDLEKALGDSINGLSIDDMGNLFVIKPVDPVME